MSTNVPLFSPFDKFDYDAFYAGTDNDDYDDEESAEKLHAAAAAIDESLSSPAITKIMERIKARDRASIKAMQHDVEH